MKLSSVKALAIFGFAMFEPCRLAKSQQPEKRDDGVESTNQEGLIPQEIIELREQAQKGEVEAQNWLGGWYFQKGERDDAENWWRKAAEQGHEKAQYELGRAILSGRATKKNDLEAADWLKKAADQGHADARKNWRKCMRKGGEFRLIKKR
jgi:TPR repeat protein